MLEECLIAANRQGRTKAPGYQQPLSVTYESFASGGNLYFLQRV